MSFVDNGFWAGSGERDQSRIERFQAQMIQSNGADFTRCCSISKWQKGLGRTRSQRWNPWPRSWGHERARSCHGNRGEQHRLHLQKTIRGTIGKSKEDLRGLSAW